MTKTQQTDRWTTSLYQTPEARTGSLTLAVIGHSDSDCKGTVTGSYRSNLDWVWLGSTGSVRSISAFCAVVAQARMGAESISRGFHWGGVYFLAGELFWVTMCAQQFSKVRKLFVSPQLQLRWTSQRARPCCLSNFGSLIPLQLRLS